MKKEFNNSEIALLSEEDLKTVIIRFTKFNLYEISSYSGNSDYIQVAKIGNYELWAICDLYNLKMNFHLVYDNHNYNLGHKNKFRKRFFRLAKFTLDISSVKVSPEFTGLQKAITGNIISTEPDIDGLYLTVKDEAGNTYRNIYDEAYFESNMDDTDIVISFYDNSDSDSDTKDYLSDGDIIIRSNALYSINDIRIEDRISNYQNSTVFTTLSNQKNDITNKLPIKYNADNHCGVLGFKGYIEI